MAYRLKRQEPVSDGLRRIAHQQLTRASEELADPSLDRARQVHQVRKRLKKLRALLRLVRKDIGREAFRRENRRLRDLGQQLSGPRDAQVMLDTAIALAGDHPALTLAGFEALRGYLQRRLDAPAMHGDPASLSMDDVARQITETHDRVDRWPLSNAGFDAIAPGLQRAYKRGRRKLRRLPDDATDAQLHAWRKRVKDHWYHSRILAHVWPSLMRCYIDELKLLSELLGDYHDLAVFQATLDRLPDGILGDRDRALWQDRIGSEKLALQTHAERLGRQVYADPPKRLRRRMRRHWNIWKQCR